MIKGRELVGRGVSCSPGELIGLTAPTCPPPGPIWCEPHGPGGRGGWSVGVGGEEGRRVT